MVVRDSQAVQRQLLDLCRKAAPGPASTTTSRCTALVVQLDDGCEESIPNSESHLSAPLQPATAPTSHFAPTPVHDPIAPCTVQPPQRRTHSRRSKTPDTPLHMSTESDAKAGVSSSPTISAVRADGQGVPRADLFGQDLLVESMSGAELVTKSMSRAEPTMDVSFPPLEMVRNIDSVSDAGELDKNEVKIGTDSPLITSELRDAADANVQMDAQARGGHTISRSA